MPPDDPDEEGPGGPPPHPLDRVWFHPTELGPATAGRPRTRWLALAAAAMLGALGMLGVLAAFGALGQDADPPARGDADAESVAAAVDALDGSVVSIEATSDAGTAHWSAVSLGDGTVVTCAHGLAALSGATLRVVRADGVVLPAQLVGIDVATDVAVVATEPAGAAPAAAVRATPLTIGEPVMAVAAGHAGPWVSTGVVAATDEMLEDGPATLVGLIATDTAAGTTTAGGALFDDEGRLVGMLTAPDADAPVGLAIPIDVVRDVVAQLVTEGRARHGWLGIAGSDASSGGVTVQEVTPGSPAAAAGVEPGDVVLALDGETLRGVGHLAGEVRARAPGEEVVLVIARGNDERSVQATLGEFAPVDEGDDNLPSTTAAATMGPT